MSQSTSTAATDAGALFRAGRLTEAVAAANAAVRKTPSDVGARVLLAELLVFSGNLERADVILDACGDMDPQVAIGVAEFRQLVRGEVARRQLFRDGRVPEFLGEPSAAQRLALAAIVALRGGNPSEAGQAAAAIEAERVRPTGTSAGQPFDDLRDADDILAGTFEVITTTGKYFWIPVERVLSMELHPPRRPRDLYWRRVSMQVADGPDGDVYMPTIYAGAGDDASDEHKLGRATDWLEAEGAPVRGVGAVTYLVGEEPATLMELSQLSFTTPGVA